jgi:hypothetical protein
MNKKLEKYKLIKELDELTKELCFKQYGKKCYVCGAEKEVMQCGHLIKRERTNIRWDLRNVRPQCRTCNLKHRFFPELFTAEWLKENGEFMFINLVGFAWAEHKWTIERLRSELSFLKSLRDDEL